MPMKLLSVDDFRAAAKDGAQPEGTLFKFATAEPEAVDGTDRTKRFVFSDATIDHSKDSIDPKGWDLSIFNKNPVALFSHASWDPPIGRASNVAVVNDKLVGDIEFATADVYPLADTIFRLVEANFLRAVSVGFMPKEWAWSTDKDRPYGIDFKQQQLLEISVCSVPCNPNALSEAKGMGINTTPLVEWAEKVLDSGDTVFLPRKELEGLRAQAKGDAAPRYYFALKGSIQPDQAEHMCAAIKRWQDDPKEILILPKQVELRTLTGVPPADLEPQSEVDANAQTKVGRKLSAATKSALGKALEHHDAMGKCIKDLMDDESEEEPNDDGDDQTLQDLPPGTVVVEETLTDEERRLKEARELRASLPTLD